MLLALCAASLQTAAAAAIVATLAGEGAVVNDSASRNGAPTNAVFPSLTLGNFSPASLGFMG